MQRPVITMYDISIWNQWCISHWNSFKKIEIEGMRFPRRLVLFLILTLVRDVESLAVAAIQNFYGAVIVLAVIRTYAPRDRSNTPHRRRMPHVGRVHHRHTCSQVSDTYTGNTRNPSARSLASENFYDALTAFMSRVNLANSVDSFSGERVSWPFVVSSFALDSTARFIAR